MFFCCMHEGFIKLSSGISPLGTAGPPFIMHLVLLENFFFNFCIFFFGIILASCHLWLIFHTNENEGKNRVRESYCREVASFLHAYM